MDVIDYIYDECHRQHVTNYSDFAKAWQDANVPVCTSAKDLGMFVMFIAFQVEPDVNRYNGGFDNMRTSHVGFMHGGSAAPAGEVRERFDRWCELAYDIGLANEFAFYSQALIKQLLDIHPWADGNGRTASILRNWMLGTLDDPSPLPYYYGNT